MTEGSPGAGDIESRIRELQALADEGLITLDEYEQHRRRIRGETGDGETGDGEPIDAETAEAAPTEAMHGRALELLDELINNVWSPATWDDNESYYLEEHAPRIVRSDDPHFQWIDQANERLVVVRLRALMSPDEWQMLPELVRARRGLALHELESDRGRPGRLAAQERAQRATERERRETEEWGEVLERARREGQERIRREEEEVERARLARETEEESRNERDGQPAPERRRSPRRRRRRPAVAPGTTPAGPGDAPEPRQEESSETGADDAPPAIVASPSGQSDHPMESEASEVSLPRETPIAPGSGGDGPVEPAATPSPAATADQGTEREVSEESPPQSVEEPRVVAEEEAAALPGPQAPEGDQGPAGPVDDRRAEILDRVRKAGKPEMDGAAAAIEDYELRLDAAGEHSLADVVSVYAERVEAVERGDLPPAMSMAPAALTPDMVGTALSHNRVEGWIEIIRNALIFMPVLLTWLKLQSAVAAYRPTPGETFFDFWVSEGGSGLAGGTLADAAIQVAVVLVLLIGVNVLLGVMRRRTALRGARIGREFAAALFRAEGAGTARRIADPQDALEGFVHASTELTTNLRSVGELLQASVIPFADSVGVAQQALREMSDAVKRQERQLGEVVERLGRVAEIGDQLGALQRDFAGAQDAASRSAQALAGIRDSLNPSARDFAGAAVTLDRLAEQLARMTEAMAGAIADLESGLDSSSGHLREAASSMNAVATRVLDDLDGRGGQGDGR